MSTAEEVLRKIEATRLKHEKDLARITKELSIKDKRVVEDDDE